MRQGDRSWRGCASRCRTGVPAGSPTAIPSAVGTPNQTKLRVRLYGIDAPETPKGPKFPGQPFGEEAAAYLTQLVGNKRIRVEIYGVDRYRRLLGVILMGGRNINLAMIEAGLREVYRGPEAGNPYQAPFQAAEAQARAATQGMWAQGERYESPRVYRRRVGISASTP